MRRPIRTPLFSRVLGTPEIPEILDFDIANVSRLDVDLAQYIKQNRDEQNKVTDSMQMAQGGSDYDQGTYDNYTTSSGYTSSNSSGTSGTVQQVEITENLLPLGSDRRPGTKLNLKGITIHSTAKIGRAHV